MNPKRIALAAVLAATGLMVAADIPAAPVARPSGGGVSAGPRGPPGARRGPAAAGAAPGGAPRGPAGGWSRHGGSPRHGSSSHGYRGHGHYAGSNWGWGLGLGIGLPWALGWYDPFWWGPAYTYPSYAYGPVYPAYGYGYSYGCGPYDDCEREYAARPAPVPPTTEAGPVAPAAEGGPTQRPLHLNYCESSKAWFPHVKTCPGGWRLVTPEYDRGAP